MPIITIANNKGGVGKTSTTLNLGAGLAHRGKKVLLIDLDSQANLTTAIGGKVKEAAEAGHHIGKVITGEISAQSAAVAAYPTGGLFSDTLFIIPSPSGRKLLSFEEAIFSRMNREHALRKALKGYAESFDYVLIDTPPQMGLLTNLGLFASSSYIIPMAAESFDYEGLSALIEHVNDIREYVDITLGGVVLNKYNPNERNTLVQTIAGAIKSDPAYRAFSTYIRKNTSIHEAQHMKQDLFSYAPESTGALNFLALTDEVISRYEQ